MSPSIGDAGPSTVNQSICCGTPVVAFEIGTAIDVIENGISGYRAAFKDVDDYAHGIESIITLNEQVYIKLRETTREMGLKKNSKKHLRNLLKKIQQNKPMSSIKGEMVKGVMWTAVARYSSLVVQILVSMVLARLLEPSEFGFITMASVFLAFFNMLASMGIGPAIIQRTDFTREDHDNVFSFSIVMGCVLSVIFFCLSWSIGRFYNDDNVIPVCQVMSLCILIATANMVPSALMAGHRRFKESALISFCRCVCHRCSLDDCCMEGIRSIFSPNNSLLWEV